MKRNLAGCACLCEEVEGVNSWIRNYRQSSVCSRGTKNEPAGLFAGLSSYRGATEV